MCTLSWLLDANGLHVFFNRDERKARPKAITPQHDDALNAIYPIDPQGGGTWLAAASSGAVYALLNNYQATYTPLSPKQSRGQIIKTVLASAHQPLNQLHDALPLAQVAPFTLVHFPAGMTHDDDICVLDWDGVALLKRPPVCSPLVSSSVDFEDASANRLRCFARAEATPEGYAACHASHWPERGSLSVCMHRELGQTVSFSHIHVCADAVSFRYVDGSPCDALAEESMVSLAR